MNEEAGGGASRTTDPAAGSSAATDVSLREFITMQIGYERRATRALVASLATFGGIIWFFVERHLADLNHENTRVASVTDTRLSADTYAANEQQRKSEAAELAVWRKEQDQARTQVVTRDEFTRENRSTHQAGIATWVQVVGLLFAGVALVGTIIVVALQISNYEALHHDTPPTVTVTVPSR